MGTVRTGPRGGSRYDYRRDNSWGTWFNTDLPIDAGLALTVLGILLLLLHAANIL